MSVFSEMSLGFKDFSFEFEKGPFTFQWTTGLTPDQYACVRQVTKHLNRSQPACRLYQETLGKLRTWNGAAVEKIEIKIVSFKEFPPGMEGSCYPCENLIMIREDQATMDKRTNLPLALTETVLFELANLSHCDEFQTIHDKVRKQEIQTKEEYGERMEREELKTLPIAQRVALESIDNLPSNREFNFWSFMAMRFSVYQCETLMFPGEDSTTLFEESKRIRAGKKERFTSEKLEEIALGVQRSLGHTKYYHDLFEDELMPNKT
jgi:hypothetical protein